MPAYSIPAEYVHKFCVLPFLFVWGFVPACSIPIRYVHKFCILTCLTIFFYERSTGDAKGLTRECDLLRSVLVMILTYHEVLMVCGPLGKGSLLGIS